LWLWCKNLPIHSQELYERLKQRGVIVVSGHHFFFGSEWPHSQQCLRLNYSQSPEVVSEGLKIIAAELRAIYKK